MTAPFSSVSSIDITDLDPSEIYLLVISVKHGGANGRYYLKGNGDTGSNYQYCVRWTTDNGSVNGTGSGGGGSTKTHGLLSPAGADNGGIRPGEHWSGQLHISTEYDDPSWTLVRQYTAWDYTYYEFGAVCADVSGLVRHHGGSNLSSITIFPDVGDMTGEYTLYRHE